MRGFCRLCIFCLFRACLCRPVGLQICSPSLSDWESLKVKGFTRTGQTFLNDFFILLYSFLEASAISGCVLIDVAANYVNNF